MRAVIVCICLLIVSAGAVFAQAVEPDIAVNPPGFDYETVDIGATRDRSFVVTNEGTANLVIFETLLQGPDANQFRIMNGGGGVILAPGVARLITVRFAPTVAGPQQAVLRIESDDPDENLLDIPLSGIGQGIPDILVTPTTLAFGNVLVSAGSLRDFIVRNRGTGDLTVTALAMTGTDAAEFEVVGTSAPFTLAPQDADTITVRFTPASLGAKSALLAIQNTDPNGSPVNVTLQGTGVGPAFAADQDTLDYGNVAVGNSAVRTFRILNGGSADLVVDSLVFAGADAGQFLITQAPQSPFTIRANGNASITVQYAPTTSGSHSAALRLYTSDAAASPFDIVLQGIGGTPIASLGAASLDFGEVLVTLDATQTITLTNTGAANLVGQASVSGGNAAAFQLTSASSFTVAPSDSVVLTLRFAPTAAGSQSATLDILSNDPDHPALAVPLAGLASTVQLDIAGTATPGQDVPFTITIPTSFRPVFQRLQYRSTSAPNFRTADLTGSGTTLQGVIPGPSIDLGGAEYFITLDDAAGNIVTLPANNPAVVPLFLPAHLDQLGAPDSLQARTLRMISVPFELTNRDVESVLGDDYGPYNKQRWRLFRWDQALNNGEGDYIEYPDIQRGFDPGVGFWIVTNDGLAFDVDEALSVDPSPFRITLMPGWNQIGNPYTFPMRWPAQTLDPRVEPPASFNGTNFQYGQTILLPWEGYFVHNRASEPITVTLATSVPSATAKAGASPGSPADDAAYLLRLSAEVEGTSLRDTENYIGLMEAAAEGLDRFDVTEAPPLGEYVRLSILAGDKRYAGNFKPTPAAGQHWDLALDGAVSEKTVRIRLSDTGKLPEGFSLYVLDQDRRRAIAVVDNSFIVDPAKAPGARHLRLLMGTTAYAEQHAEDIPLVPRAFSLAQNYPNPFNPSTTIRYQLEASRVVRLDIFNLLGQRVRTLVDAPQEAGVHSVRWDGRNEAGEAVASGVYVYRLRAGSFVATQTMLLIR